MIALARAATLRGSKIGKPSKPMARIVAGAARTGMGAISEEAAAPIRSERRSIELSMKILCNVGSALLPIRSRDRKSDR